MTNHGERKRACRRPARAALALAVTMLAASATSLFAGTGAAQASCIYNVGSGPDALAFNFSSTASGSGGYSSSYLSPGDAQCWYAHGWSNGFIRIAGSPTDLLLAPYFTGVDVELHGWVEAEANNEPEAARNELCTDLVLEGMAHVNVFGDAGGLTGSASNELPVEIDCFAPINPVE